jgi:hypothetical protein
MAAAAAPTATTTLVQVVLLDGNSDSRMTWQQDGQSIVAVNPTDFPGALWNSAQVTYRTPDSVWSSRGAVRQRLHTLRRKPRSALTSVWARLVFVVALAAFATQSFLVQTHVHFTPSVAAALAGKEAMKQTVAQDRSHGAPQRAPSNDDTDKCPLCQEFVSAGSYVAPSAVAVLPPNVAVSTIAREQPERAEIWAISHNWQGRAPPQA